MPEITLDVMVSSEMAHKVAELRHAERQVRNILLAIADNRNLINEEKYKIAEAARTGDLGAVCGSGSEHTEAQLTTQLRYATAKENAIRDELIQVPKRELLEQLPDLIMDYCDDAVRVSQSYAKMQAVLKMDGSTSNVRSQKFSLPCGTTGPWKGLKSFRLDVAISAADRVVCSILEARKKSLGLGE